MDSAARDAAEARLRARVTGIGAEQQKRVVEEVASTVIRDKLVDPRCMVFDLHDDDIRLTYMPENGQRETVAIHRHALGQLADKSRPTKKRKGDPEEPQIVRRQMWELMNGQPWHRKVLVDMFNAFYTMGDFRDRRKNKAKFLNRIVGSELRGFLSRSYNRNLNTAVSLRTFLEECGQHGAGPYEATATPVRTRLKCILPQVFEPVPGEFVAFGVAYSNSDFGAGMLGISNFLLRLNSLDQVRRRAGHVCVLEKGYSKTHLGSIIKESDIDVSDDTANKEVAAVNSAIRDVVKAQLDIEAIEKTLEAIRVANHHSMPWNTVQELLSSVLSKQDVETAKSMLEMGVQDLPDIGQDPNLGPPQATGWWASNLVGWFAEKAEDPDRKAELQSFAGDILVKSAA